MNFSDHHDHSHQRLQVIGAEVAIAWSDGVREPIFPPSSSAPLPPARRNPGRAGHFRASSTGGAGPKKISRGHGRNRLGAGGQLCAPSFDFLSDGHRTGLYTFPYLRKLSEHLS